MLVFSLKFDFQPPRYEEVNWDFTELIIRSVYQTDQSFGRRRNGWNRSHFTWKLVYHCRRECNSRYYPRHSWERSVNQVIAMRRRTYKDAWAVAVMLEYAMLIGPTFARIRSRTTKPECRIVSEVDRIGKPALTQRVLAHRRTPESPLNLTPTLLAEDGTTANFTIWESGY